MQKSWTPAAAMVNCYLYMPLRLRQLIFVVLAAIFVIAAPAVMFYAAGYRYNFDKNSVEKTGALVLDSAPAKAGITLNNRNTGRVTPASFNHLLPDDYLIRMEKDGYHAWEKTLSVVSGRTTFATNVLFFRNASPQIAVQNKIQKIVVSPKNDAAIFTTSETAAKADELWLWDMKTDPKLKFKPKTKIDDFAWSATGNNILIKTKTGAVSKFYFITKDGTEAVSVSAMTGKDWRYLAWSADNDSILTGITLSGSAVYKINLSDKSLKKIGSGYTAVWEENSKLFALLPGAKNLKLLEIFENTKKQPVEIAVLKKGNYNFIKSRPGLLTVLDTKTPQLYVIDPKLNNAVLIEEKASLTAWSPSWRYLLLSDGFELNIFEPEKNEIKFITRYGTYIKKALWINSEEHLLLEFNDSVWGIEIDSRDNRYSPTLVSGKNLEDLFFDAANQTVFFTAETNTSRRLFALPIK